MRETKNYECWEIFSHTVEYLDDIHQYIVDGIIVKSITQALKSRFGNKYATVDASTLKRASEQGTEMHLAIQNYCEQGTETDLKELKNFKFLQKQYHFSVLENEIPVILFMDDEPICAGRLDMVIQMDGKIGGADLKRTSTLDKEYLALQLNLYRIAYRQCYGVEWEFLKGIHLRENVRKFVDIPINEELAWEFIKEWRKQNGDI